MTENRLIAAAYKLYCVGSDEIAEEATEKRPFVFITGFGFTLPKFEAALEPLQKGDTFDIIIPKADAYGDADPENIITLDKTVFTLENGKFDAENVFVGNVLPMTSGDGQSFQGTVTEVTADKVVMDFNAPLCGYDLHFVGRIVDSHKATPKEIEGFITMLSGEPGGCGGCGGGGCSGEQGGCAGGGCGGNGCGGC